MIIENITRGLGIGDWGFGVWGLGFLTKLDFHFVDTHSSLNNLFEKYIKSIKYWYDFSVRIF